MVRQLRGGSKKESSRERRERREVNAAAKDKILTFALPILLLIVSFLIFFIYMATRSPV